MGVEGLDSTRLGFCLRGEEKITRWSVALRLISSATFVLWQDNVALIDVDDDDDDSVDAKLKWKLWPNVARG